MFIPIEYLNLRFPMLLNVALSLPQRTSYGRSSSALMSGDFGLGSGSGFDFKDFSSFSSLDDVPYASAFLRENSLRCCFTDMLGKAIEFRSIFFLMQCRSPEDIAMFNGRFIHNIADDSPRSFGLFLFRFRLYEIELPVRGIKLLFASWFVSLLPNVKGYGWICVSLSGSMREKNLGPLASFYKIDVNINSHGQD